MCADFTSVRECVNPKDLYSYLRAQRLKSCIMCPALWSLFVKHGRIFLPGEVLQILTKLLNFPMNDIH